ncbi:MAG: sodium/proline symporter PutP [Spirochaetaceae bacterium]|jgi:sodium/proline symporter|nr:sodium/proline symporter PutP [Spirochaetaceae bacterium]
MSIHVISMVIAFVIYLGGMILIGLRHSKNMANSEDFFLGARSTGPWVTALSAEASDMSGWLLMGLPGVAYLGGMKEAFWTAFGLTVGTYLNWFFVAKRLRKYTIHAGNAITIPEFFTNRFKDKSHLISLVSVIFIVFFFTIYTASGFVACAKLFNAVFGIPYAGALVLGIVIILVYTVLGGYLAVCSTDFVQGSLMFIALVVTAIVGAVALGGPVEAVEKVNALGESFLNPLVNGPGQRFGALDIISALGWGLGYFGMPHILVRFMGLRSNQEVRLSRRIATGWVIIAFIGALLVGVFGKIYLFPLDLSANGAQETVFIQVLLKMFPSFIAGIFLCGILAAAMSTADSQLLVAASAFSRDIYTVFLNKNATEKQNLLMSRITVLIVAAVAFVIALDPASSIFSLVSYAWAGFGATFGPLVLLSLFWKGATRNGALAGLVCGGVTVIVWKQLGGGIFNLYEIIPGFAVCLLVTVIVSLLDKPADREVIAEYEAYQKLGD